MKKPFNPATVIFKSICLFLACSILQSSVFAQVPFAPINRNIIPAYLPPAAKRIEPSRQYSRSYLAGMSFDPADPWQLHFIIDPQDNSKVDKAEAGRLVEYFLAALSVPDSDLWVNLSPYESQRIVPEPLSRTALGRDMLAQDYLLKQLMSSLMYPESSIGKNFWDTIFQRVYERYHKAGMPVNTFHKICVVPDEAVVAQDGNTVRIRSARLKVMLESDYLAMQASGLKKNQIDLNDVSAQVMREVVLPAIEKEVNEGENFAVLRQIYYSLILAVWFKRAVNVEPYSSYISSGATSGIQLFQSNDKENIYRLYLQSQKRGVYDYIRREYDRFRNKYVFRRYYSGGEYFSKLTNLLKIEKGSGVDTGFKCDVRLKPATVDPVSIPSSRGKVKARGFASTIALAGMLMLSAFTGPKAQEGSLTFDPPTAVSVGNTHGADAARDQAASEHLTFSPPSAVSSPHTASAQSQNNANNGYDQGGLTFTPPASANFASAHSSKQKNVFTAAVQQKIASQDIVMHNLKGKISLIDVSDYLNKHYSNIAGWDSLINQNWKNLFTSRFSFTSSGQRKNFIIMREFVIKAFQDKKIHQDAFINQAKNIGFWAGIIALLGGFSYFMWNKFGKNKKQPSPTIEADEDTSRPDADDSPAYVPRQDRKPQGGGGSARVADFDRSVYEPDIAADISQPDKFHNGDESTQIDGSDQYPPESGADDSPVPVPRPIKPKGGNGGAVRNDESDKDAIDAFPQDTIPTLNNIKGFVRIADVWRLQDNVPDPRTGGRRLVHFDQNDVVIINKRWKTIFQAEEVFLMAFQKKYGLNVTDCFDSATVKTLKKIKQRFNKKNNIADSPLQSLDVARFVSVQDIMKLQGAIYPPTGMKITPNEGFWRKYRNTICNVQELVVMAFQNNQNLDVTGCLDDKAAAVLKKSRSNPQTAVKNKQQRAFAELTSIIEDILGVRNIIVNKVKGEIASPGVLLTIDGPSISPGSQFRFKQLIHDALLNNRLKIGLAKDAFSKARRINYESINIEYTDDGSIMLKIADPLVNSSISKYDPYNKPCQLVVVSDQKRSVSLPVDHDDFDHLESEWQIYLDNLDNRKVTEDDFNNIEQHIRYYLRTFSLDSSYISSNFRNMVGVYSQIEEMSCQSSAKLLSLAGQDGIAQHKRREYCEKATFFIDLANYAEQVSSVAEIFWMFDSIRGWYLGQKNRSARSFDFSRKTNGITDKKNFAQENINIYIERAVNVGNRLEKGLYPDEGGVSASKRISANIKEYSKQFIEPGSRHQVHAEKAIKPVTIFSSLWSVAKVFVPPALLALNIGYLFLLHLISPQVNLPNLPWGSIVFTGTFSFISLLFWAQSYWSYYTTREHISTHFYRSSKALFEMRRLADSLYNTRKDVSGADRERIEYFRELFVKTGKLTAKEKNRVKDYPFNEAQGIAPIANFAYWWNLIIKKRNGAVDYSRLAKTYPLYKTSALTQSFYDTVNSRVEESSKPSADQIVIMIGSQIPDEYRKRMYNSVVKCGIDPRRVRFVKNGNEMESARILLKTLSQVTGNRAGIINMDCRLDDLSDYFKPPALHPDWLKIFNGSKFEFMLLDVLRSTQEMRRANTNGIAVVDGVYIGPISVKPGLNAHTVWANREGVDNSGVWVTDAKGRQEYIEGVSSELTHEQQDKLASDFSPIGQFELDNEQSLQYPLNARFTTICGNVEEFKGFFRDSYAFLEREDASFESEKLPFLNKNYYFLVPLFRLFAGQDLGTYAAWLKKHDGNYAAHKLYYEKYFEVLSEAFNKNLVKVGAKVQTMYPGMYAAMVENTRFRGRNDQSPAREQVSQESPQQASGVLKNGGIYLGNTSGVMKGAKDEKISSKPQPQHSLAILSLELKPI